MLYTYMRTAFGVALVASAGVLGACTTSQEQAAEVGRPAVPAEIITDADRQAAYNSNAGYSGSAPDATPGRVPSIRNEASSINSEKRLETINTNAPNNTPTETRLRRLNGAPVDTMRLPPG